MHAMHILPLLLLTMTACEPDTPGDRSDTRPTEQDPTAGETSIAAEGPSTTDEGTDPDSSGGSTTAATTETPPCTVVTEEVGIDDPVLDGLSAADLLAALELDVTVLPTWWNHSDASLTLQATWTGGPIEHVSFTGVDPECDEPPTLQVPMITTVVSSDGQLDESFPQGFRFESVHDQGVGEYLDFEVIAGDLDIDTAIAEMSGLLPPFSGEVSAFWSWRVEGDPHGTLEVVAWPGVSDRPDNPLDVIEFPIASW
jgi:hypothetical protein